MTWTSYGEVDPGVSPLFVPVPAPVPAKSGGLSIRSGRLPGHISKPSQILY